MQVAGCGLQVAGCGLQVAGCRSRCWRTLCCAAPVCTDRFVRGEMPHDGLLCHQLRRKRRRVVAFIRSFIHSFVHSVEQARASKCSAHKQRRVEGGKQRRARGGYTQRTARAALTKSVPQLLPCPNTRIFRTPQPWNVRATLKEGVQRRNTSILREVTRSVLCWVLLVVIRQLD
jgi:hypothetical protein